MGKMFSTDLARDQLCGRIVCWPCQPSKEGETKNCKTRSILYETSCIPCNPVKDKTAPVQDSNLEEGQSLSLPRGEGRYLPWGVQLILEYERASKHMRDARSFHEKSHIVKHWMDRHRDMNQPPAFRFRVLKTFKDCLTRWLSEAINIHMSKYSLLNSKNEYITNCINHISVQEGAMERKIREREEEQRKRTWRDCWNSRRRSPGLTQTLQKKH